VNTPRSPQALQYDWCADLWTPPVIGPPPFPELPDEFFEDYHDDDSEPDIESCDMAYARAVCLPRFGPL